LDPYAAVCAVAVLLVGQRLLWEAGEARVPDHVDRRVGLEELGDQLGVLGLLPDPEHHGFGLRQCADSAGTDRDAQWGAMKKEKSGPRAKEPIGRAPARDEHVHLLRWK